MTKFRKTFYSLKYKIGTDELSLKDSLKLLDSAPTHYLSGYTSILRKEIKVEEKELELTINYEPSLSPLIYAKTNKEFFNVKCYDITSFYPYLLTQVCGIKPSTVRSRLSRIKQKLKLELTPEI